MNMYAVVNENNSDIGTGVLALHYGKLWKSALDRINHQLGGYLITVSHQGNKFLVYRKLPNKNKERDYLLQKKSLL